MERLTEKGFNFTTSVKQELDLLSKKLNTILNSEIEISRY